MASRPNSGNGKNRETIEDYSEEGLAALLIIIGVVLFFFPEPITSFAGIALVLIGAIVWLADYFI